MKIVTWLKVASNLTASAAAISVVYAIYLAAHTLYGRAFLFAVIADGCAAITALCWMAIAHIMKMELIVYRFMAADRLRRNQ